MKKLLATLLFLMANQLLIAQDDVSIVEPDSLYREDQFYAGVTYNLLGNLPSGIAQNGFSSGFHLGFIRDMPINKRRNLALGFGIGYSWNSFNQNLLISKGSNSIYVYSNIDDDIAFSKNKFSQHLVEIPFEFRWRSSSATEYKFWRIYTGFKTSYVAANSSKYKGEPQNEKYKNIKDFNDLQYGLTLSVGYNTWNFYLYYALNPIFDANALLNNESMDMNAIKIGLIFYIL
ncbi:MAG: PorT family protein [Bacteroidia bacterium]|nr:PorT family protein [Bacteroidia bacterium]